MHYYYCSLNRPKLHPPASFHLRRTQIALSAEVSTFEWRSSSSAALKRGSARSVRSSTYITPLSRDAKFVCLGPSMPRLLSHAQLLYKVLESARKPSMALVTAQASLSPPDLQQFCMFCILSSQGTERRERLKNANPHLLIVAPKGPPIPSNTLSFNTLQYPLQLVLMGASSALPDPEVMFP